MIKPEIPDFRIEECCGSGAYGDVWTALDRNGIQRAVKVLNITRLRNLGALQREEKAIELFRTKVPKHRNLVEIFHVGETKSVLYYAMELADNFSSEKAKYLPDTLEARLKKYGAFEKQDATELANAILDAVEKLHAANLVHRDIKPSNIIYADGIPKLADIGLTAFDSTSLSVAGTPAFIPPEKTTGPEADLYAMGKLLYCAFSGNPPEKFPSLPDSFRKNKKLKELEHLNKVALKACAKRPTERFRSVEEFRAALGGCKKALRLRSNAFKRMAYLSAFPVMAGLGALYLKLQERKIHLEKAEREQLMNLADLELKRMHPALALDYLERIRKRWPEWTTQSEKYFKLKDNAQNRRRNVNETGSDYVSMEFFKAAAVLKNDPAESLKIMETLWNKEPRSHQHAASVAMYALALEKNGEFDEALKILDLMTKLKDPAEAAAGRRSRCQFFMNRKQYKKALEDIDYLIAQEPDDSLNLFTRYEVCLAMKDYKNALSDLKKLLKLNPGKNEIKELIKEVASMMNRKDSSSQKSK